MTTFEKRWLITILLTLAIGLVFVSANVTAQTFAVSPLDVTGNTGSTYSAVLDAWNDATWNDIVDEDFSNQNLAAVRWYNTEGQCTGEKCEDQLHSGNGKYVKDISEDKFYGVTDEFSNVLLAHAMGSREDRYLKLHNFAELLRVPGSNNLQGWMYYINGKGDYDSYDDVVVADDSASDASIRILGAYSIACAKQKAGDWTQKDYCTDYENQGKAIFGLTGDHGEIKKLSNGRYFLANGYNNNVNAPTTAQSIRPDYYELQFLQDFAVYMDSDELEKAVSDIFESYRATLGTSKIHKGKTGHFNADGITGYQCDDLCSPTYMDNIDTWRAIPAISGLFNVHKDSLTSEEKQLFYDWYDLYVKPYSATGARPFEIYSDSGVKNTEMSYKTLSMWIPLTVQIDPDNTKTSLDYLINNVYDLNNKQFSGSAYYGGYFSQFAQRAIGSATGMISPEFWADWDGSSTIDIPTGNEDTSIPEDDTTSPEDNTDTRETIVTTQEFTVENLRFETSLNVKSDEVSGDCRAVVFETTGSDLQILTCKKSDTLIEAYKQSEPGVGFRVDIENDYLDNSKGFAQITKITSTNTEEPSTDESTPPTNDDTKTEDTNQKTPKSSSPSSKNENKISSVVSTSKDISSLEKKNSPFVNDSAEEEITTDEDEAKVSEVQGFTFGLAERIGTAIGTVVTIVLIVLSISMVRRN